MGVEIHNLIAAIVPDVYCDPKERAKVKKIAKEEGYLKAAEVAKLIEIEPVDWKTVDYIDPFQKLGLKYPTERFSIQYDAAGASLEPTYFWLTNMMNIRYKFKVNKIIDNFVSSPGSGHFSEMGAKATRMQEEGMKILGTVNQIIKSILNLIYDLKEFKIRLGVYKDYKSKDELKKSNALLSLKQIWMDNVDIKRANTSLKAMAQQFDYVTLIDAFMAAKSEADAAKLDLNDRVKRIINQRISEFFRWVKESDKELSRRFEMEKSYLKSQLNTVKLYSKWVKPYLKSAKMLEQNASSSSPYFVNMFNTAIFELTLMGAAKHKIEEDQWAGWLSKDFVIHYEKAKLRTYNFVGITEIKFISIPDKINQQGGYGFRGRLHAVFRSYALNNEEVEVLKKELEKDDFGEVFGAIAGATKDSLEQIQTDIDEIIGNGDDEESESKPENQDINPFTALFWFLKKKEKKEEKKKEEKWGKEEKIKIIKPDTEIEKVVRSLAALKARKEIKKVYDAYKKSINIPTYG